MVKQYLVALNCFVFEYCETWVLKMPCEIAGWLLHCLGNGDWLGWFSIFCATCMHGLPSELASCFARCQLPVEYANVRAKHLHLLCIPI